MKSLVIQLSFLLFCGIGLVTAQDYNIVKRTEEIHVVYDSLFTRDITVLFEQQAIETIYPIFFDDELEVISNIELFEKKRNRFKQIDDPVMYNDDVDLDYITSKKITSITIPANASVKLTYRITCNELKYFSDLRLFSYSDIDTMDYTVNVPAQYELEYDIIHKDSLKYLEIDSIKSEDHTLWTYTVVPVKVRPNPLMYFGIYRNIRVPLIRTIVIPASHTRDKKDYLNNWYLSELEATRGLDSTVKGKIDEITFGIIDTLEIISTLYDYVRSNFKYVAIEIGMGAFIPTHVNEVYLSKQGDCKDLSNFLSEALNYKGIRSNVALAATYHHISDCDFPSLCAANHVICIAYVNGKPVILDPTDPVHLLKTPVESIQDRTILIVDSTGGEYYRIDSYPPGSNLILYDLDLRVDSENKKMQGDFSIVYTGISGNFVRRMFLDKNETERLDIGKKHYEAIFNNQTVTDFSYALNSDTIVVTGKLSIKINSFSDSRNSYLFPDFFPRLFDPEDRETLLNGAYIGNTINKRVSMNIEMDNPFIPFQEIEHSFSDSAVSLDLSISSPNDTLIKCKYEFMLNYIQINQENVDSVNEIFKSYKRITDEPIILENKI